MDAGCGGSPKSYQSQVSNSAPYTELWVRVMGAYSVWNDAPWLEFYKAWYDGGRAPGHTHFLWSSIGGSNGCSNQRWNNGYTSVFGDQMLPAFKSVGTRPRRRRLRRRRRRLLRRRLRLRRPPAAPLPAPQQLN